MIDSDVEDVMWVKMYSTQAKESGLLIAVCYIPPEASSSGRNTEEKTQLISELVEKYIPLSPLIVCGNFNARCGDVYTGRRRRSNALHCRPWEEPPGRGPE